MKVDNTQGLPQASSHNNENLEQTNGMAAGMHSFLRMYFLHIIYTW